MISETHKQEFEKLRTAIKNNKVILMECFDMKEEKHATLIVVAESKNDNMILEPFALMFDENPVERFIPPKG